jgi:hypothetical protein
VAWARIHAIHTSKRETRYASAASCSAMTADDWKRRSVCETVRMERTKVGDTHLEVLGDFTDEALERELADEELGGLLVATNLAEGDGARAETMGLLDTAGCVGGLFACCGLCGELEETSQ